MESMEAKALKSSFFSEYAMKGGNTQAFPDDFWCLNGVVAGEDFSIDEFFDLPNEENKDGTSSFLHGEEDEEEEKDESSLSMSSQEPIDDNHLNFSADLAVPVDDLQELELWSHFMDDSVPEATLACPKPTTITIHTQKPGSNRVEPGRKRSHGGVPFIPTAVPVKPRSKRPRTAWKTDSSGSAGSSSSTSPSSSPISTLFFPNPVQFSLPKPGPAVKKPKKKQASTGLENGNIPGAVQRRCSHCQVTKTPQWRAGPNGPKTLCNACGVRFKSGRLFPEYRPACSPTFSSEIHSNSHRKVLEMRKMKEMTTTVESESGSTVTTMESIESS